MEQRRLKTGSCLAPDRLQSQVKKGGWIVERNKIALVQYRDVAWGRARLGTGVGSCG